MSEHAAVASVSSPATVASLQQDLRALGVRAGSTLLLHTSVSSLGWVAGGAVAVVDAVLAALGPAGTVVVPTQTGDLTDPADWGDPPVPESWWPTIRDTVPPYRPAVTPSRGMGLVPELVRTWPGARRSEHPLLSFAALGPAAQRTLDPHRPEDGLGERSPLGRLYDDAAAVLLLGVGYDRCTALHLAEYRAGVRRTVGQSAPVLVDGQRRRVEWTDLELDETDFPAIGVEIDRTGAVRTGRVAHATARLFGVREAVDTATGWLRTHPGM